MWSLVECLRYSGMPKAMHMRTTRIVHDVLFKKRDRKNKRGRDMMIGLWEELAKVAMNKIHCMHTYNL